MAHRGRPWEYQKDRDANPEMKPGCLAPKGIHCNLLQGAGTWYDEIKSADPLYALEQGWERPFLALYWLWSETISGVLWEVVIDRIWVQELQIFTWTVVYYRNSTLVQFFQRTENLPFGRWAPALYWSGSIQRPGLWTFDPFFAQLELDGMPY